MYIHVGMKYANFNVEIWSVQPLLCAESFCVLYGMDKTRNKYSVLPIIYIYSLWKT